MNWPNVFCFLTLAVLCNTAFPLSFDPVLIHFATRQASSGYWVFALIGSVCASLGAVVDVQFVGWLQKKVPDRWIEWLPLWNGNYFYLLVFLFALLPLPFSVVRLASLRRTPRLFPYGLAVFLGRLPRYLLTLALWPVLGLPAGSSAVLLCVGLLLAVAKLGHSGLK